jgi:preprotein translocase subunit SecA
VTGCCAPRRRWLPSPDGAPAAPLPWALSRHEGWGTRPGRITLWHLDRGWADHLSYLADLREGIYLRALGRGLSPLDEFRKEATRAFAGLLAEVEERSAESFETVLITADGADLGAAGLKRPTATWTYLVQDNPFGTDLDRAMRSVARALRKLLPT